MIKMTANRAGVSQDVARRVVDAFIEAVTLSLRCGERVGIKRFGAFSPTLRNRRTMTNPKTGEPMEIAERMTVSFLPSPTLKDRLNA